MNSKNGNEDTKLRRRPRESPAAPRGAARERAEAGRQLRCLGQRLLCEAPGSLNDIATLVGASRAAVANWRTGIKLPAAPARERLQEALGIPITAWDVEPESNARKAAPRATKPAPAAPVAAPAMPDPLSDLHAADELIARARQSMLDPQISDPSRRGWAAEFARGTALRHKLIDGLARQEAHVAQHPTVTRTRDVVMAALKPYPEALRAVLAALQAHPDWLPS